MKLTLLSQKGISSITMPNKVIGRYWLHSRNRDGKLIDILSVEALRSVECGGTGKWIVKSNRRFTLVNKAGMALQSAELEMLELYYIQSISGDVRFALYTEPITDDRIQYSGYLISNNETTISIGRNENNSICYLNEFTSGNHAEITFSANGIFLKDLGSKNNTYVNECVVKQDRLSIGDVVYIMGLSIIITNNGLFLNNPDGKVRVNAPKLQEFHAVINLGDVSSEEDFEDIQPQFYYRAPRFRQDVKIYELKVDSPPSNQDNDELPMIMLVGPSVTMGMASIASGIFTVVSAVGRDNISSAIPSLVMCFSMLLGTLMWPLVTKTYQKKLRRNKEKKRQKTYTSYLDKLEKAIAAEIAHQETLLRNNDADTNTCVERILSPVPQIWERTSKHADFLRLRLGCGKLPFKAHIQYPERKFAVDQDNLTEMMYQFGEKKRWLEKVPICLSLTDFFISGIYGDKSILYTYAKELILQIVAMHGYDEVKLVLLYDESHASDFSFARYLPHTMNDERTVRYIATDSNEAKLLSSDLDSVIEYRKNLSESKLADEKIYYVIICLDKDLASKAECVRRVLEYKDNLKFSVLSIFERLADLPKECMTVTEIRGGTGKLTTISNESENAIPFQMDIPQKIDIRRVTDILSNTFIDISGSNFILPKKYSFFEMLDIGMIEHLNIAENWSSNDPTKSLAAVIGVDKYGEPFKLDLHEHAHGPHGLVAGMTGSGKSEFIISYILSMAVSYHPNEVAFILIDYKGGGMAKSFENIPHTAGVITNLDGNGIKRSLSSMRSELHRREQIFRDTTLKNNVSNIDIYKYQKLYREGKVKEPLPHLFIISDEFAELKKEQPDFMTELTSTARVGRSLGVHLILATQKPGGVVDDQIRSNSRFKVCLKVQDSGDSQEMLGRSDAAFLVDTGRFYLQVGFNELFEIGQSAWAGAPYYPAQKVVKDLDDAISVVNTNGRIIAEANTNRYAAFVDPPKQLDVITEYIAKYCEEENITRWKMWLDPIPSHIYVDELIQKYRNTACEKFELEPVVGELDDPAHQRQDILRVPLTKEGNMIIYGSAGSGKAMFIEAMCYSLMREHTPDEVNIYILDFGSETFTAFVESPFVGDVILSYETEKVNNLFKLMMGKMETRKKLLSQFGGSISQYNVQADKIEPNIVVIINNFAAFGELFEEKAGEISYLTREGTKYGIYFVLACTGINNVRFSMLQNFKLQYCLQLNNADDYSAVVGKTEGLIPDKFKGRGIFRLDKDSVLEFQTARITEDDSPYFVIRTFCKKLAEQFSGKKAMGIPILPEKVTEQFLLPYVSNGNLSKFPIGVEKSTLEISYFDFSAIPVNLVLSAEKEWNVFTTALGKLVAKGSKIKTILLAPMCQNFKEMNVENLRICVDTENCVSAINDIFAEILHRNNEYKDKLAVGEKLPEYEQLFVMIQSISLLKNMLENYSDYDKCAANDTPINRLQTAMGKCVKEYNVFFVIGESVSLITPFTAENWYKTHINSGTGIWAGAGIDSQYRLKANKKLPEFSVDISSDFGFAINKSVATFIKLLQ